MQSYFDDPQSQPNQNIIATISYFAALTVGSIWVAIRILTGWIALGERNDIPRSNINSIEWFIAFIAALFAIVALRTLWGLMRRERASWDWAQWGSMIAAGFGIVISSYTILASTNASEHRTFDTTELTVGIALFILSIFIYQLTTAESLYTPGRHISIQFGASPSTGAIIGFVAIFLGFAMAADSFLFTTSIANSLTRGSTRGIIAIAVTILMISGEFDLSVGSILGVAGMTFILTLTEGIDFLGPLSFGAQPVGVSIVLALGFALVLGLVNGVLLVTTGIPSFIVTLGTLFAYRAITLVVVSEGRIIRYADYFDTDPIIHIDRWLLVAIPLVILAAAAFIAFQILPQYWNRVNHNWSIQHQNGSFGTTTAIASGLWALVVTALLGIVILWGLGAALMHAQEIKSIEGLGFLILLVAIVVTFFYLSRFLGNEWQTFKQQRTIMRQISHEEMSNQPFYVTIANGIGYFVSDLLQIGQKVIAGFIGILLSIGAFVLCLNFLFVERDGSLTMSFFNLVNSRWSFTFEGVTHGLLPALNIPVTANFRNSIIWWVILVAFFHIILTRTRYGNAVFATGGNTQAARAQGINVTLIKVQGFMLTAFLAGLAAILETSRSPSVDPTEGTGWELETIAMTVVGGALLTGGYGSVIGTMLGTLIFGMLATGLVQVNLPNRMFEGVVGVIMISAVILNNITKRRS